MNSPKKTQTQVDYLNDKQLAYLQALKVYQIANDGTVKKAKRRVQAAKLAIENENEIHQVDKILEWMLNEDSCIGGFACPRCGFTEHFTIEVPILLNFDDDGEMMDEPHCDREWDDASYCRCPECGHEGKVMNFSADCPECHGDGCEQCGDTGRRHPAEGPNDVDQP